MAGALSSVMSIAGAGFLPNPPPDIGVAVTVNAAMITAQVQYQDLPVITRFQDIVANASPAYESSLRTIAATDFPPLTDHIPASVTLADMYPAPPWDDVTSYVPPNQVVYLGSVYQSTVESAAILPTNAAYWDLLLPSDTYFSPVISTSADRVLGNGDLTKFCQLFMAAVAYQQQTNQLLAELNSSLVYDQTFNASTGGMDSLTTGGLNQVTTDIPRLARDLLALGQLIDLTNLDDLGLPGELVAQIGRVSGGEIPALSQAMRDVDFATATIRSLSRGVNTLTSVEELQLYRILQQTRDDTLAQIKTILGVSTPNIFTAADLLDPLKILPGSYDTLVCPTPQALVPVYINGPTAPAVNSSLRPLLSNDLLALYTGPNNTNSLQELSRIIPGDQALATKAFVRGLQQVKNIAGTQLPQLAASMTVIETNQGLGLITALDTVLPATVTDFYRQSLGQGTGPNDQLLLTDVVGVVSGQVYTQGFEIMTQVLTQLNDIGQLESLLGTQGVYTVMEDVQAGDYTQLVMGLYRVVIPSPLPGAGTYGDFATEQEAIDDAFVTGLIPAATSTVTTGPR